MLPTNNEASTNGLVINPTTDKIQYNDIVNKKGAKYYTDAAFTYNHIYITSDEEIKESDWYIDDTNNVRQSVTSDAAYWSVRKDYRKIIATTDKSLLLPNINFKNWDGKTRNLPSPSDGFIRKFIEKYNAGTPIMEVMIEYEDDYSIPCIIPATDCEKFQSNIGDCKGCIHSALKLKVDSNNYITITAVKDSWTRKEVMQLCFQAFIQHKVVDGKITPLAAEKLYEPFNKWIEENL